MSEELGLDMFEFNDGKAVDTKKVSIKSIKSIEPIANMEEKWSIDFIKNPWNLMHTSLQRHYRIVRLYNGEARMYYKSYLVCNRDVKGMLYWVDSPIIDVLFTNGAKLYAVRAWNNEIPALAYKQQKNWKGVL